MIFFALDKPIDLTIHTRQQHLYANTSIHQEELEPEHVYCTTPHVLSILQTQCKRLNVHARIIPETKVRSLQGFPVELGYPGFLENQLHTLASESSKAIQVALINGLGAGIGDSVIGFTALRIVQRLLLNFFKKVRFDALIRADRFDALVQVYEMSGFFEKTLLLPIDLKSFLKYDAFFNFSGLTQKADSKIEAMAMVDFFLYCLGIRPEQIAAEEKRNRVIVPLAIQQEVNLYLQPLKQQNPLLLFHPQTSTPVRSIPEKQQVQLLNYFIEQTTYTIISVVPSAFKHPRFHDFSTLSSSYSYLCAIVSQMDAVICADTSVYHIADAFDIAGVALFSTIDPNLRVRYYPYIDGYLLPEAQHSPYYGKHVVDPKIPLETATRLWEKSAPDEILTQLESMRLRTAKIPAARKHQRWFEMARIYHQAGKLLEAECLYQQILAENPQHPYTLYYLGHLAVKTGGTLLAIHYFQRALQAKAEGNFYHALGVIFLDKQNLLETASHCFTMAIQLDPHEARFFHDLGVVKVEQKQMDLALSAYQQAALLDPKIADRCEFDKSIVLLLNSQLREGFKIYEKRLITIKEHVVPPLNKPLWDGSPLGKRRLLVHFEQGSGDTFQFIRYLPLIPKQEGKVIFAIQPALKSLLTMIDGVDEIVEGNLKKPTPVDYDVWLPLISLAHLLGTTLETIPAPIPYLFADSEKITYWQHQLAKNTFNIGLVWAGNPQHPNDIKRSCPFTDLIPLTRLSKVICYSLQKGAAASQAKNVNSGSLISLDEHLKDFTDTAAVVASLDLVITVDTAMAHLAGALGKPVWVLLPFAPDWRWFLERTDSPWYPTMRLFRQPTAGDWQSVIKQVLIELQKKLKKT